MWEGDGDLSLGTATLAPCPRAQGEGSGMGASVYPTRPAADSHMALVTRLRLR